jgi:hypothetical protein
VDEPALLICGLGPNPREDATFETLCALSKRRQVYAELENPEHFAWLKENFPGLKRAPSAAKLAAEAKARGNVALAVWGHAQASTAAAEAARACRKAGASAATLAANSPAGAAVARSLTFVGGTEGELGIHSYRLDEILKHPELLRERFPLVVFAERGVKEDWARLGRALAARYGEEHRIWLQPSGAPDRRARVKDLETLELSGQVLVPVLKEPR